MEVGDGHIQLRGVLHLGEGSGDGRHDQRNPLLFQDRAHFGRQAVTKPVSVRQVQRVAEAQGLCLDQVMEKYIRRVAKNVRDYLTDHVCPKYTLERILREGMPVG